MKTIRYQLNGKTVRGTVIKENPLTIWTKTPDGKGIKRHKIIHNVAPSRRRG